MPIEVTAIFDIGKTNKKLFLFNDEAKVVYEKSEVLSEIIDEDGFACEDITLLEKWVKEALRQTINDKRFSITKLNFSAYGASLVHLNKDGKRIAPLYNYLKPIPSSISEYLYQQYNGKAIFSATTASPPMEMLNSGLQLLWLKKEKPILFDQIDCTLHLPQYLSYLFSGEKCNELTSIGCHTAIWNFKESNFHNWVYEEDIEHLFPDINPYIKTTQIVVNQHPITCGIGLHDSSSALIPYLKNNEEPFMLLSTGTWNIALNPFSKEPLTIDELNNDCLSYLSYQGDPVKASRLFFGNEHDYQVKRLNAHFHKETTYFKTVKLNSSLAANMSTKSIPATMKTVDGYLENNSSEWNLDQFTNFEQAYHELILALVQYQVKAIQLAKGNTDIKTLFVDGGFANNTIFIALLKQQLKDLHIIPSDTPNASALGAFMLMNG